MYKILHLICYEKFTGGFINFVSENFDKHYHEFWVYGERKQGLNGSFLRNRNVKYERNIICKLKTGEIYEFDKVICHGLFEYELIDWFAQNRNILKKVYLYFWGGDKFYLNDRWKNLKKKYVIEHVQGIINIISEEKKFMRKYYNFRGKHFTAKYCSSSLMGAMREARKQKRENKDYIAIQVGNSASVTNNHIKLLRSLYKFRGENIRIYAPLSYGDKQNAVKVIDEGKALFGDKFVPIMNLMQEEEYYLFMRNMDIALFGMKRQQALANIEAHLYFGNKVFLLEESILEYYFRKSCQCYVEKVSAIAEMEFNKFVAISDADKERNYVKVEELYEVQPRVDAWNKIFDDVV